MSSTTPRDIIDDAELADGQPLGDTTAAAVLKDAVAEIGFTFIQPDGWRTGGSFKADGDERRLEGNLANYLVRELRVTGRKLRYDVLADLPAVRVAVVLAGDGEPDTELRGWMAV